ncbi:ATP-binding protein [Herbiconiux sp. CPCC 203407]|uniref:ATP-binding protein n=1 Tax=Herbiconiux oxytropis TaxID=2970915 RepID=A0AA41XF05_9MICO|nr:ATP-binding protein [Herbiconiux oxytropis]MCS5722729.1 ATP-binding protein [Herbiconiux oxytropis]MCS5726999.1 ATP-binding protein [Herbiconiux oxytropis]
MSTAHPDATSGTLRIGTLQSDEGDDPAELLAAKFNRHTFWCGQSGSGKTYALGVVLEQLLIETALPMLVFDPNADFVRLAELRTAAPDAPGRAAERDALAARDIRILRPAPWGGVPETSAAATGVPETGVPETGVPETSAAATTPTPLRARFVELSTRSKAAVLGIDPLRDRLEYNALLRLEGELSSSDAYEIAARLQDSENAAARDLALRIENLQIMDWEVWAGDDVAVTDLLVAPERPDATVLDIGGFAHPDEYLVVALSVLEHVWRRREERRPLLIVIDEAHNLCAPEQDSPLGAAVRDRLVQIAAEGRKFGLWLLLSTQRPSRVHPSILSQCDNLALMKMSSPFDLDELAKVFGYAPRELLERAPLFRQGEALFAGGFAGSPSVVRMGERLTPEGGVDVPIPLRRG